MPQADFPQIHQEDAPPEIAAIYADIRAASGVPVVNLIWRHFAALPGVLPWAWDAAAPLVRSAEIEPARRQVAEAVALPPVGPLALSNWRAAGADADGRAEIAQVADAYVRGNLTNLIVLTALRMWLDDPGLAPARLAPGRVSVAPDQALPPLPRIDALDAATAAQVRGLAARHDGSGEGVIPSLYLALAKWPGVLAALPGWLPELYLPARLRQARESVCDAAERAALGLIPDPGTPPDGVDAMRPALQRFTRLLIPDLIPVCVALRRLVA